MRWLVHFLFHTDEFAVTVSTKYTDRRCCQGGPAVRDVAKRKHCTKCHYEYDVKFTLEDYRCAGSS